MRTAAAAAAAAASYPASGLNVGRLGQLEALSLYVPRELPRVGPDSGAGGRKIGSAADAAIAVTAARGGGGAGGRRAWRAACGDVLLVSARRAPVAAGAATSA